MVTPTPTTWTFFSRFFKKGGSIPEYQGGGSTQNTTQSSILYYNFL